MNKHEPLKRHIDAIKRLSLSNDNNHRYDHLGEYKPEPAPLRNYVEDDRVPVLAVSNANGMRPARPGERRER